MFDNISQSVNVPKRDLLSVVANLPPGSLNGCKWCEKTILWNGGTWVHVNDRPQCDYIPCASAWVKGKTEPVEIHGFFGSTTRQAPVSKCSRCDEERAAFWGSYTKAWRSMGSSECKAAIATPIANLEAKADE